MPAQLLDGKTNALRIKEKLKTEIEALKTGYGVTLHLVNVQVGENPASEVYLKSQEKNAEKLGIRYSLKKLAPDASQDTLKEAIEGLNRDDSVNGILVQMPLPRRFHNRCRERAGRPACTARPSELP